MIPPKSSGQHQHDVTSAVIRRTLVDRDREPCEEGPIAKRAALDHQLRLKLGEERKLTLVNSLYSSG